MAVAAQKQPRQNLTQKVIETLRDRIVSGQLKPGDKLPTEQELNRELGVSRTVIREAVASLRADGLVQPKQGVGVFVMAPPPRDSGRDGGRDGDGFIQISPQKISDVIEALELRTAVEVESAALAASRCSPAQEAEICSCFDALEAALQRGDLSEAEDFDFHLSIARATNNPRFVEFLGYLGNRTIPRSRLREEAGLPRNQALEEQLNQEHRAILEAILRHDPDAARAAMRQHLAGGTDRYRSLARAAHRRTSLAGE
ncbi:FadR/GntR family transcriptional regulator [Novispirillum itersonii]|uniref:FadR/GntR family transcriptional regulator n=1 Tax=Novispirillum itersonii TaxID=189 RepID=UPI000377261D|nr:FadR/GntR family transcriptional regulator [Novispirillum itersonii]